MSRKMLFVTAVGLASIATSFAVAQNQPADPNAGGNTNNGGGGGGGGGRGNFGGGGGGGGRGNFDPAQFQKMMMDRMKEELKSPDDEWAVIEPKLEAVVKAQNDARVGGRGGPGGPGGGGFGGRGGGGGGPGGGGGGGPQGGPGGQQDQSDLAKATRELRTALDADNSSPETIAGKLKALRDARDKAEADLKTAREGLKAVLSERQEAVLVSRGILE